MNPTIFIVLGLLCFSSGIGVVLKFKPGAEGAFCTLEGTPDENATYRFDAKGKCVMTCNPKYKKDGERCIIEYPCEEDLTIASQGGSLGVCYSANDVKPIGSVMMGSFISDEPSIDKIHLYKSTSDKNEFISAHQSEDNFCKMVRFEISKEGEDCNYKLIDARYATSPRRNSTCQTEDEVKNHFDSPVGTTEIAANASATGYGIKELKYNKFC